MFDGVVFFFCVKVFKGETYEYQSNVLNKRISINEFYSYRKEFIFNREV